MIPRVGIIDVSCLQKLVELKNGASHDHRLATLRISERHCRLEYKPYLAIESED